MSRTGRNRLVCVLMVLVAGAFVASEAPAQAKKLKIGVIFDYTGPATASTTSSRNRSART